MDTFNDFLITVEAQHQGFVQAMHEKLIEKNFKIKIESKASGFFVSYSHSKTKRSLLNFLFRKNGLLVRIYPSNTEVKVPSDLTASMKKEIEKSPDCKLCNDKCPKGYNFSINGQLYDRCRYNAFLFAVTEESKSVLTEWIQAEINQTFENYRTGKIEK